MFTAIGNMFRAIGRIFNILDILAKEGELVAKSFAKENAVMRQRRMEALERGEDPDADQD
jgi:hypothetical protein